MTFFSEDPITMFTTPILGVITETEPLRVYAKATTWSAILYQTNSLHIQENTEVYCVGRKGIRLLIKPIKND